MTGDEITFDFTGSAPETDGYANSALEREAVHKSGSP